MFSEVVIACVEGESSFLDEGPSETLQSGCRTVADELLLSRDFLVLVTVSCLIATPLAVYFLKGWLQKYDYRISMGPGVFLISSMAALFITIVTISFQAIKAAIANPVKSLRAE